MIRDQPRRPLSKTRVVRYAILAARPEQPAIDEGPLERLLGAAKRAGVVTEFDTGRGRLVWFEGPPGAALRELRTVVRSAIASASAPSSGGIRA